MANAFTFGGGGAASPAGFVAELALVDERRFAGGVVLLSYRIEA